MSTLRTITAAAALAFTSVPGASQLQEDEPLVAEVLPEDLAAIVDDGGGQALVEAGVARGVLDGLQAFEPGAPIEVCFYGGTVQLRTKVAEIASAWNGVSPNIKLNFGQLTDPRMCRNDVPSAIRVGFTRTGDWSLIGKHSMEKVDTQRISLNLHGLSSSKLPSNEELHRRVLHEFGHALGFRHEQQNSRTNCDDEYKWDEVSSFFSKSPNFWPKEQVKSQMSSLNYFKGAMESESFDKKSIMTYPLPQELFTTGSLSPCFASRNTAISPDDAKIAKLAYTPKSDNQRQQLAYAIEQQVKVSGLAPRRAQAAAREIRLSLVNSADLRRLASRSGLDTLYKGQPGLALPAFSARLAQFRNNNSIKADALATAPMNVADFKSLLNQVGDSSFQ